MGKIKKEEILKNKKQILLVIFILVVIFFILYNLITTEKITTIKEVNKILDEKYSEISCIKEDCNYILAITEKSSTTKKYIYNINGKKISSFDITDEVSDVTDNYIIFKKEDNKGYYLTDLKTHKKYNTKNELSYLTNNLILVKDDNYEILNSDGNILYSDVDDVSSFYNDKIVLLNVNNSNVIIDEKGNKLLVDYTISKEITDENNNSLYLVIKNNKNNLFYYYDVNKNKIVGDNFQDFTEYNQNGTLLITKVKDKVLTKYLLTKDGKQKKYNDKKQVKYYNEIRKYIDQSKYNIYEDSVYSLNQTKILVDNKEDKSFGVYNIKKNTYKKIYDYSIDSFKSNISKLDNNHYQIVCEKGMCDKNYNIIYDLKNQKVLFKNNNKNTILKYTLYDNNYKTIKYSSGKYILYNSENKKINSSDKKIIVIDKEVIYTNDKYSDDVLLYSANKNTIYNNNGSASIIKISNNTLYKYNDNDDTCIVNKNNKIITCFDSSNKISYSSDLIYYISDNKVTMINAKDYSKKIYKLKRNEKINDINGNLIEIYKNSLFVNNSSDNYIKIVSNKGKVIKKIKNAEINTVKEKSLNVLIFTKKTVDNEDYYGLYIAK